MRERDPNSNLHHIWWERRDYRTCYERKWRNQSGFVIPTRIIGHVLLHEMLDPPPKPSVNMMHDISDAIGKFNPREGRLSHVYKTREHLWEVEGTHPSPEVADKAGAIARHLTLQLVYLEMPELEAATRLARIKQREAER